MSAKNLEFQLAERPETNIIPGRTFKLVETNKPTAADIKDGQVLVEVYYLSLDPAMRVNLQDFRSYVPPVAIGERMRGYSLSKVLASKSSKARVGDLVVAFTGWTEFAIVDEQYFQPGELPEGTKITDALGAAGLTGVTAYIGLERIGQPKRGETVVVSGAAGATGLVVGQICKIKGCRVVGIAGSDEKCEMLTRELGFDLALNYKSPTFRDDFVRATPDFIDVFWDGVGGEILEMALDQAAEHARFVICGTISGYNNEGMQLAGVRNMYRATLQRVRLEGFIITDHMREFPAAQQALSQWICEGKIRRKETIIRGGLEAAEHAVSHLFTGKNTGKLILEIKPYEG
ncbi:NAD(P)-binding protein [Hypoxylon cercidicola]|nr:NAD(P)-binding protein [Hypoxylon cercidicola]